MSARRVLVIDDDADSASMLAALLRLRLPGCASAVAHDGKTGIAVALADCPDTIIVDLELPDLHGVEVAKALRTPDPGRFRLIAVSGNVDAILEAKRGTLFDAALTKPVDVRELLAALTHVRST
jgi:DNA-binding response OmpR family regulator